MIMRKTMEKKKVTARGILVLGAKQTSAVSEIVSWGQKIGLWGTDKLIKTHRESDLQDASGTIYVTG